MFNMIVERLGDYGISLPRLGEIETGSGSEYKTDAPMLFESEGWQYMITPKGSSAEVFAVDSGELVGTIDLPEDVWFLVQEVREGHAAHDY